MLIIKYIHVLSLLSPLYFEGLNFENESRYFKGAIVYNDSCKLEVKSNVTSSILVISNVGDCESLEVNPNLYLDKVPLLLELAFSNKKISKLIANKSVIEVRFNHKISNWHIVNELNGSELWLLKEETLTSMDEYKKYLFSEIKKTNFTKSIKKSFLKHGCTINLSENFADSNFSKPHFIYKSDLVDWRVELSTGNINKNVFPNLKGGIFFDIQNCSSSKAKLRNKKQTNGT